MSKFKSILPLIILTLFILLIFYYYQKNQEDFLIIQKLDPILIFQIIFLCSLYLLTEGIVLKNIVVFLGKKISIFKSFLIMSATYFCNTFIQFSGLGYRVYYLKKFNGLKISEVIRYSLDTIACELIIFSFIGIISLLFIDLNSESIKLSYYLYLAFIFFFISSSIYLFFLNFITLKIKNFLNNSNFFSLDKILLFFLNKKKNSFLFYKKQFLIFCIQYIILFLIFFLILKKIEINNYFDLSLMITSLVDFSFLIAITPYSVGISEFVTFIGTRDIPLTFAEILILINVFRICMIVIYFICGPIFILINLKR